MALTINAKTYTANNFSGTKVGYVGPLKTVTVKDDVVLNALGTSKETATYSGMSRSQSRLTRTLALAGAKSPFGDALVVVDVAVPVGAAAADIDALLNDMGSYLASATAKTVVKSALVNY